MFQRQSFWLTFFMPVFFVECPLLAENALFEHSTQGLFLIGKRLLMLVQTKGVWERLFLKLGF